MTKPPDAIARLRQLHALQGRYANPTQNESKRAASNAPAAARLQSASGNAPQRYSEQSSSWAFQRPASAFCAASTLN